MEGVDVFCFGHLLYEMTYGQPPDSVPIDHYPPIPYTTVGQYLHSPVLCDVLGSSTVPDGCVCVCVYSVGAAVHLVHRSL